MENRPDKQNKYRKNSRVEQVVGEVLNIEGKCSRGLWRVINLQVYAQEPVWKNTHNRQYIYLAFISLIINSITFHCWHFIAETVWLILLAIVGLLNFYLRYPGGAQ